MSRSDDALYQRFLGATLTPGELTHRAHVQLAYLCVQRHPDLAEAAVAFRGALKRLVEVLGAGAKYSETITWAYLVLVHQRCAGATFASSDAFVEAHPELIDHRHGALSQLYDVEAVLSTPAAKALFLLPGDERLRQGERHG